MASAVPAAVDIHVEMIVVFAAPGFGIIVSVLTPHTAVAILPCHV